MSSAKDKGCFVVTVTITGTTRGGLARYETGWRAVPITARGMQVLICFTLYYIHFGFV